MKILQIGIGRWGKNHLKTLTKLCDELYVVDVGSGPTEDMRGIVNSGRSSLNRLQDFLDRVDGVDIVTPADNHLAIARECFERGKMSS